MPGLTRAETLHLEDGEIVEDPNILAPGLDARMLETEKRNQEAEKLLHEFLD